MNPLDEDSWKCSKLLLRPNFHKTKKSYSFKLLWIAPTQVMNGLEPIKGKSYTKEICQTYATEKECLEGINNFTMRAYEDAQH